VTAQDALKAALRDLLGPAARSHGYKGSSPTWRKASASGDWAVVNLQSSTFSRADDVRCVVNVAFAPEPWLRWQAADAGGGMPKSVPESLGLYRQRLHPAGSLHPAGTRSAYDAWWAVSDEGSAHLAVADMNAQLDAAGWPVLESMFSRDAMLARLHDGDLGFFQRSHFEHYFVRAEALLLMDAGPSAELEACLDTLRDDEFGAWVRTQAARG
jgi:hypothetical protein